MAHDIFMFCAFFQVDDPKHCKYVILINPDKSFACFNLIFFLQTENIIKMSSQVFGTL
jgi:hypothetical protein